MEALVSNFQLLKLAFGTCKVTSVVRKESQLETESCAKLIMEEFKNLRVLFMVERRMEWGIDRLVCHQQ